MSDYVMEPADPDEERISVWVRPFGRNVFHLHAVLPTRIAFALVHKLRRDETVAWAYCDEPKVIPGRAASFQESKGDS